jgi:hypothetical protein
VAVDVGVAVGVKVGVMVGVGVALGVKVAVGVRVKVTVAVGVGVAKRAMGPLPHPVSPKVSNISSTKPVRFDLSIFNLLARVIGDFVVICPFSG